MSGLKVTEQEKWGRETARQRYGAIRSPNMKPKDESQPQFRISQPADKSYNDVPENSWLRGSGEDGRPPNFDKGKR